MALVLFPATSVGLIMLPLMHVSPGSVDRVRDDRNQAVAL
jgi:hypothetical protein